MHCIHCGSEVSDNAKFCLTCGKKISLPSSEESGANTPPVTNKGLFTPKGKKIAIIAGISALSIILVGSLIFGSIVLFSSLNKDKSPRNNASAEASDTSATDVAETTDAVASSETEATLSQDELDTNTYVQYITDTLTPRYGIANLEMFRLACEWGDESMDLQEFMPEDRKGIVSAITEDMNGDGSLELIVVIAGTFDDPVIINNNDGSSYTLHYDGVEIKVFQIVNGAVQEMLCDNTALLYPTAFALSIHESIQVCILDNANGKYLYVYSYYNVNRLNGVDAFQHDIYQVTDTGVQCLESIATYSGVIVDALDTSGGSSGTETFSIWTGDVIGDYYTAIQNYLTPYGLDFSWLDNYYNDIQVSTESETEGGVHDTYSHGRNELFTPLSAMISDIKVITMVGGRFWHDEDTSEPIQSFMLVNLTDGLIAQPVESVAFPNAQAEAVFTVISDKWTQDSENITLGAYTVTTVSSGVVSYNDGTEIVAIEISAGTDGIPYARTYGYKDGQLIYASIDRTGSGQDYQLYFTNGKMFRMCFDYGYIGIQTRDNAIGDPAFVLMESIALEEAMQVLSQAS